MRHGLLAGERGEGLLEEEGAGGEVPRVQDAADGGGGIVAEGEDDLVGEFEAGIVGEEDDEVGEVS